MKKHEILVVIFFLRIFGLFAQTENNKFVIAEDFFSHQYFSSALVLYQDLLKLDSSNANLNFKIGVCYLNSRSQKTKALSYLEKAILGVNTDTDRNPKASEMITKDLNDYFNSEGKRSNLNIAENSFPIAIYKFLGDAYQLTYKFDLAITYYEKFKKDINEDKDSNLCNSQELDGEIEMCKFGKKLKGLNSSSLHLKLENIGKKNNFLVDFLSFHSFVDPSKLLFTSNLSMIPKINLHVDAIFFEDFYYSAKTDSIMNSGSKDHQNLSLSLSKDDISYSTCNEAAVGTSMDGQIVLIYKVDKGEGNLYTTCLRDNKWTKPEKLNKTINAHGWEPNEFISVDGNTLFFTSNREGGYGGNDIYKSKKLPGGTWSKAINLGPIINTPYDEEAPFIYPDGGILYFSSNRNKKIGCFDIFRCSLSSNGTWSKPFNIGYPVSKIDKNVLETDDINELARVEEKKSSSSIKENNEKNNYIKTFYNDNGAAITLIKRRIEDESGKPVKDIKITVADNETGVVLGVYYPNNKTKDYLFMLPSGINNNVTYEAEGYLFQSEHYTIIKDTNYYNFQKKLQLYPISIGSKVLLNNIFFDTDNAILLPVSNVELNKLFLLLTNNPNLTIEISDYIDSKEKVKIYKKLAFERSDAVKNYLINKGINKDRVIAKGYVEYKLKDANKKKYEIENSQREQLYQRLELKILVI